MERAAAEIGSGADAAEAAAGAAAEAGAGVVGLNVTEGGLAEADEEEVGGQGEGVLGEEAEGGVADGGAGWSPEELQSKFPSVFGKKAAATTPAPAFDAEIAHIHTNSRRRFGTQLSSAGYGETVDFMPQTQPQGPQEPHITAGERLEGMQLV